MIGKIAGLCLLLLFATAGGAPAADDDIAAQRSCNHCGMDRKAYGYSRMVVIYEDGARVGVCSIHCAVTELRSAPGRRVKSLLVADRNSREMITAKDAVWVMGGKKRGVMTPQPKWAFATRAKAEDFITANGGAIAPWETVLAAATAPFAQTR